MSPNRLLGPRTFRQAGILLLLCGLNSEVCVSSNGADWPRFRGPNGSGVSTDTGLPTKWSATKNVVWETTLPGSGASSPITWGRNVYVTCYSGYGLNVTSPGSKDNLKRHLICIDGDNGRILWNRETTATGHEREYSRYITKHGYATSTPTADDTGVYAFFGVAGVVKYSHAGKLLWKKSCGTRPAPDGSGSSPTLYENMVVINAREEAEAFFGLDKLTGDTIWKRAYYTTWSTPVRFVANGNDALVFTPEIVIDPKTGKPLWSCTAQSGHSNSSAVVLDDIAYFSGDSRIVAFKQSENDADTSPRRLWENSPGARTVTPLVYEGYIYWITDHGGIVCCADAKTGEMKYKQRLEPHVERHWASPVAADGKIYFVSLKGGTHVLAAGPELRILAHNAIETDSGRWIGTPAISRNRLILRSDSTLYCIGEK